MSAVTPPPDPQRPITCLTITHTDPGDPDVPQHYAGAHYCTESLDHGGDHRCGGVAGCGYTWPRRS